MAKNPQSAEQITVTFAGINYPGSGGGLPFNVNQTFTLPYVKEKNNDYYLFQGEPDANGVYPFVKVNDTGTGDDKRVLFNLYRGPLNTPGTTTSDVFLASGDSPLANTITVMGVPYGGTATIAI